jgi:hypothetical protein
MRPYQYSPAAPGDGIVTETPVLPERPMGASGSSSQRKLLSACASGSVLEEASSVIVEPAICATARPYGAWLTNRVTRTLSTPSGELTRIQFVPSTSCVLSANSPFTTAELFPMPCTLIETEASALSGPDASALKTTPAVM